MACDIVVGAGLRPVVMTAASNLIYNITTKTDGNGEVLEFKDYKFRMPNDHVQIYAEFEKVIVNPSTGFVLPIAMIIGCIMCGVFVHYFSKSQKIESV